MSANPEQPVVRFTVPPGIAAGVYSNYVDIKTSLHDYVLTFYHLLPVEQQQPVKEIDAQAVSRVVISPSLLEPLVKALQQAEANRAKIEESAAKEA